MRDHHLGVPKTTKSRRTITISPALVTVLRKQIEGKAADDCVFVSNAGYPLHNADFATHVWRKLITAPEADGIGRFRFHDLRHTHSPGWSPALRCRTSRPASGMSPALPRSTPMGTCSPQETT